MIRLFLVMMALTGLRADINNDGRVDLADLSILCEEWLMSENVCITGEAKNSIEFNGSGVLNISNQPMTASYWYRTVEASGDAIKIMSDIAGELSIGCKFTQNQAPFTGLYDCGSMVTYSPIDIVCPMNDGQWHHVAVVIDCQAEVYRLYGDGVLLWDYSGTWSVNTASTDKLLIFPGGTGTDDSIDQIVVLRKLLTTEEIAAIYNSGDGIEIDDSVIDDYSCDAFYTNCDYAFSDGNVSVLGRVKASGSWSDLDSLAKTIGDITFATDGLPVPATQDLPVELAMRDRMDFRTERRFK